MIQRCAERPDYAHVNVCERWRGPNGFANFLADVGERPPGKTLDRFPNGKGNYEPGNVRWATPAEQSQNLSSNVLNWDIVRAIRGRAECGERIADIARHFDLKASLVGRIVRNERWIEE